MQVQNRNFIMSVTCDVLEMMVLCDVKLYGACTVLRGARSAEAEG